MRPIDVHRAWAPAGGTWSPWVKPVLFAESDVDVEPQPLPHTPSSIASTLEAMSKAASYRETQALMDTAIVIDLPSAEGTKLGVALTEHGFRPIPLYNALPSRVALVDVTPIMEALAGHAEHVANVALSAPPAFLLDANRTGPGRARRVGVFDNRSVCRPSDFPSSDRLVQSGIRRILLVTEQVQTDLELIALEWQAAGLELWQNDKPIQLRRWWLGRRMWSYIYEHSFERRNDGAYGAMIIEPGGG